MSRYIIYTYENVDEFNRLYNELEKDGDQIYSFLFEETGELLKESSNLTIDISSLVENLKYNPGNIQPAIYNLKHLDDSSRVIVKSNLLEYALEYLYQVFYDKKPLYEQAKPIEYLEEKVMPFKRKILYTYKNGIQLDTIIEFADANKIPFTNFSRLSGSDNQVFRVLCKEQRNVVVDITTVVRAVNNSPQIVYLVEQLFESFPHYIAIVREDMANEALDSYRLLFSSQKPVTECFDGLLLTSEDEKTKSEESVRCIVDLDTDQLNYFFNILSEQLIGHNEFKIRFERCVRNYIMLNKIKEKKIFSIFLLGDSGLGKTEVARIIKNNLNPNTSFVKINFGNYSSKDALNSLIGSPKGYIGCEDGELGVKVSKSKAGIVLCDEFEKATFPVFNFFLELLEDGIFTDSMSREYNLDGYIFVFTSNINEKQFCENIPPELQSRFDLVCEFKTLTRQEKKEYVKYQLRIFLDTLKKNANIQEFTPEEISYFESVNIDSTDNLRDIKRMLRERVLSKIRNKV